MQGLYVDLMLIKSYFSHLTCRLSQKNTGQNKNDVFTQQTVKVKIFSVNSTQQSHYKHVKHITCKSYHMQARKLHRILTSHITSIKVI